MALNQCAECAKKDAVIAALQDALSRRPIMDVTSQPYSLPPTTTLRWDTTCDNYAERCACNPKNGGSGICVCINGGLKVICGTA